MSSLAVLGIVACIPPRTLDVKLFYYLRTSPLVLRKDNDPIPLNPIPLLPVMDLNGYTEPVPADMDLSGIK